MNAQDRLHAARLAASEGKFEQALTEYVWFHEHALQENPSLYGVRLSFAMSYWKELAAVYPLALDSLLRVRDLKTETLQSGRGNRELFHDVAAINRALEAHSETARLFRLLDASHSELAHKCADIALASLVAAEQYALAAKYLPSDISSHICGLAEQVCADVAMISDRPRSKSPRYRAYLHSYADALRMLTKALSGSGQTQTALTCQEAAIANLKPWYVRKAVTNIFKELD